jgi:hypothetical protein
VRSVHPPDELLPAAYALAAEIADNTASVSVALLSPDDVADARREPPHGRPPRDSRGILYRGRSAGHPRGVASFLEKRPPEFPDRVSADLPDLFPDWVEPDF